jgi:hypothetical protein
MSTAPPAGRASQRPRSRWEALEVAAEQIHTIELTVSPQVTAQNLVAGKVTAAVVATRFLAWDHGQQDEFALALSDSATPLQRHHVALAVNQQKNGSQPSSEAMRLLDFTHQADEIALRYSEAPQGSLVITQELAVLQERYPQPALRRLLVQALGQVQDLCEGQNLLAVKRIAQGLGQ